VKRPRLLLLNLSGIGFRSTSKMAAESYSQGINQHKCVGLFRYSDHRQPKLTMRGVISYLFF